MFWRLNKYTGEKNLTFIYILILGEQQQKKSYFLISSIFLFIIQHQIYVVMTKSPHKEINMGQGQITGEGFRELMLRTQCVQWYTQEERMKLMVDV